MDTIQQRPLSDGASMGSSNNGESKDGPTFQPGIAATYFSLMELPIPVLERIASNLNQQDRLSLLLCNSILSKICRDLLYTNLYVTNIEYVKSKHSTFLFDYEKKNTILTPNQFHHFCQDLAVENRRRVKTISIEIHGDDLFYDCFDGLLNLPNAIITKFERTKGTIKLDDRLNGADLFPCFNFRAPLFNKNAIEGGGQITNVIPMILTTLEDYRSLIIKLDYYDALGYENHINNSAKAMSIEGLILNLSPGLVFEGFVKLFTNVPIDFNLITEFHVNNDNYECIRYFSENAIVLNGLKKFKVHYRDDMGESFSAGILKAVPFENLTSFQYKFEIEMDTFIPVRRKDDGLLGFFVKSKTLFIDFIREVFFDHALPRLINLKTLSIVLIGINTGGFSVMVSDFLNNIPTLLERLEIIADGSYFNEYYNAIRKHEQTLKELYFVGLLDDFFFWAPSSSLLKVASHYKGYYLLQDNGEIGEIPENLELINSQHKALLFNTANGKTWVMLYTDIFDETNVGIKDPSQYAKVVREVLMLAQKRSYLEYTDDNYVIPKLGGEYDKLTTIGYIEQGLKAFLEMDVDPQNAARGTLYKNLNYVVLNGLHYVIQNRNPILVSD